MTQPSGNCPNCGAPITFAWSSSVQTVCTYCKSILVRTDVDLKKVGVVADLPANSSPIQIGTEGIFDKKSFRVIGRIIYEYELGTWNEWHVITNDGQSEWLSDAQDEYAVTFAAPGRKLPKVVSVNQAYTWDNVRYHVTTITKAHYRGVEGELPFEYWDADEATFADLKSEDGHFATLDFSGDEPVLYLGRMVDFDDLHLKNLRSFEGWS
jgi:Domain of unknown function (DUF4178)